MPRRRKKSSRSSRKPPLVFSESPLDLSLRFASPATGAVNPVTAEIISLQDQHHTTWVSPQFDPTAPPSARRRKGRRKHSANTRTACSQNPNSRKDILADIHVTADENRVCDRRKLDYVSSDESFTDDESPKLVELCVGESNKENGNIEHLGREVNGGFTGDSDMNLCSLVKQCTINSGRGTFSETPPVRCDGRRDRSPHRTDKTNRYCASCSGSCLALAADTPVQEYNLRVSKRNRRGRLPKDAWEKLMAGY